MVSFKVACAIALALTVALTYEPVNGAKKGRKKKQLDKISRFSKKKLELAKVQYSGFLQRNVFNGVQGPVPDEIKCSFKHRKTVECEAWCGPAKDRKVTATAKRITTKGSRNRWDFKNGTVASQCVSVESRASCCKEWTPDCWDVGFYGNNGHACSMSHSQLVSSCDDPGPCRMLCMEDAASERCSTCCQHYPSHETSWECDIEPLQYEIRGVRTNHVCAGQESEWITKAPQGFETNATECFEWCASFGLVGCCDQTKANDAERTSSCSFIRGYQELENSGQSNQWTAFIGTVSPF